MIDSISERRADRRVRAPKLRASCRNVAPATPKPESRCGDGFDGEGGCALLDVSAGGMRIFVTEPLFAELPLSLRVSKGRTDVDLEASVRWTRELPSAAGWIVGVRVTRGRERLAALLAER